jgi:hypothetical protein
MVMRMKRAFFCTLKRKPHGLQVTASRHGLSTKLVVLLLLRWRLVQATARADRFPYTHKASPSTGGLRGRHRTVLVLVRACVAREGRR